MVHHRQLLGGRVAISFASGWHTNDFIFAPEIYDERKEVMFRHIELIQKLWAGEKVKLPGPGGSEVEFRILAPAGTDFRCRSGSRAPAVQRPGGERVRLGPTFWQPTLATRSKSCLNA